MYERCVLSNGANASKSEYTKSFKTILCICRPNETKKMFIYIDFVDNSKDIYLKKNRGVFYFIRANWSRSI